MSQNADLVEHALHVGQLEQHDGVGPIADRVADRRHELGDVRDVFQRVPADDDVGVDVGVPLVVEVGDPLDVGGGRVVDPLRMHTGIDADAVAGTGVGHLDQELALAAPDLEHRPVGEVVVVRPTARRAPGRRP